MRILSVCLNPTIDISSETDSIYPVSKIRTHSERISPGGGGVNVARVLSSFGRPCELIYISGGGTGRMLDEELERYGINTRCFHNSSPTRVAFTVLQTSNRQEYRFVPEGPVVSTDAYSQLMDYLEQVPLNENDMIVASGSLPRGVPDTAYARIAHIAQDRRARLILDSSGAGLSNAVNGKHAIYLVKPSLNELQRLAGQELDETGARDFAASLVADGRAEHVAVSMGTHGAFLAGRHSVMRLPAHLVAMHSAVGAGDSFLGAMVYYLSRGHPIEAAFRFGVAAGAAAVMNPGDELCRPADVEALFRSDSQQDQL
ncbi:MAG: hexose kinase [Granulosicoccus sp.]|nr:hexose kinase [Granulosicoccus sp.]